MEAFIFDLEGVIIDSENTVWTPADTDFIASHGKDYDMKIKSMTMGNHLVEGTERMKDYFGLKGDIDELVRQRESFVKKYLMNTRFIMGFLEFYNEICDDYKACVATSLRRKFIPYLDRSLNLSGLFDIYSIDDIGGVSKPNPDIFLYAAKRMNVLPERCVVIEDSPNGIKAAKRAGMYCIGITNTVSSEHLGEADMVVESYEEIDLTEVPG